MSEKKIDVLATMKMAVDAFMDDGAADAAEDMTRASAAVAELIETLVLERAARCHGAMLFSPAYERWEQAEERTDSALARVRGEK